MPPLATPGWSTCTRGTNADAGGTSGTVVGKESGLVGGFDGSEG